MRAVLRLYKDVDCLSWETRNISIEKMLPVRYNVGTLSVLRR